MLSPALPSLTPSAGAPWLLDRLNRGQAVAALGVRGARTPEIARLAKASGHELIWVDLEHSAMPIDVATQICGCAFDIGVMPIVRVPEREYGVIGRLLDGGAMGIIAPRVETAAQAADIVAACKFPPHGHRSAVGTLPFVGYRRMPPDELYRKADVSVLVKILIESPLGIRNLPEIAAVPGVDLIAIGTNDLTSELGVPGDYSHASVREAHLSALAACKAAGKPLAIGGIADLAYSAELVRLGAVPLLMTGIDTDILLAAAQSRASQAIASVN